MDDVANTTNKVNELRQRVDEVDRELIEALSERARIASSSSCIESATSRSNAGSSTADMDVSAGVKTNVKTTNGMIRPDTFRVIAGPCTVESYEQFVASARAVKQ